MKRTHSPDDNEDFGGISSGKKVCSPQDQQQVQVTVTVPSSDELYVYAPCRKDIGYAPCRKDIGLLIKAAEYLGDFPFNSLRVDVNTLHHSTHLSLTRNDDEPSRLSPPSGDSDANSQALHLPLAQTSETLSMLSPNRSDSDASVDTVLSGQPLPQNGDGHTTLSPPETDLDDSNDDPNLITCWCRKPHGQRNMILCNSCNRWLHFSCVKIRKDPNPGSHYTCTKCVAKKQTQRKSERRHIAKARFDT